MINKRNAPRLRAAFVIALAALPFALFGQTNGTAQAAAQGAAQTVQGPQAVLVYADNPDVVEIVDAAGVGRIASIGDEIRGGETLKTAASAAEIKLTPNGSIIKVARNTKFKVTTLAGSASGADTNEFALLGGKIRTVAAKSKAGNKYLIRTPSAVCGVRGTDFALNAVEGERDSVAVKSGLVEFAKIGADGVAQPIMVAAGQFADAFAAVFSAAAFSAEQFAQEFADVEFTSLNPADVPNESPEPAPAEEPKKEEEKKEAEAAPSAPVAEPAPAPAPSSAADLPKPKLDTSKSKIMTWLGEMLGFELGSVVIDGNTYSKAIIQPTFNLGKLKLSLYLPVIYTDDLFNPNSWYMPKGNNEWSFGSEYYSNDPIQGAGDALRDLALKIRYIEYGNQAFDPVYLKVGNLSTMTIGHGVLMRNFANDSDFPAVRRVGLNAGADTGFWGVEGVVNDLAEPEIFGGRFKILKFIGLTILADIDPAGDLSESAAEAAGKPMFFGTGLDLDLPIANSPVFALRAFADAAAVVPLTRASVTDGTTIVPAGFQYKTVYDPDKSGFDAFNNYGIVAGLMGKMLFIDWRLEYRQYRGAYRPTFFNAAYERNRAVYAQEFKNMLLNPAANVLTHGIYGEAGFSLLKDKLTFNAGYMMPWSSDSAVPTENVLKNDYLQAKLLIKKGLIPILDLSGSFSYERTGFAYALMSNITGVGLFDANTVLKGEVVYPIASSVDFAIVVSTATAHTSEGAVIYETVNGQLTPKVEPTVTFETRVRF